MSQDRTTALQLGDRVKLHLKKKEREKKRGQIKRWTEGAEGQIQRWTERKRRQI